MASVAGMPQGRLTPELIQKMRERAGIELRIEHSIFNEEVTRLAVTKFSAGIGDPNPLWTEPDLASRSVYGAAVAPPSFVLACFSGIQFGWAGLGSFHSATRIYFGAPIYWGDVIAPSCRYEGFEGPSPSKFAGKMVLDHFTNVYRNQGNQIVATAEWDVVNFERASAQRASLRTPAVQPMLDDQQLAELEAQQLARRPRGADRRYWDDVEIGEQLEPLIKGPLGLTDEIAFLVGGGAPIPRLAAHSVALRAYREHPAWAFRDQKTMAMEPIYSVHYNDEAAHAMGVPTAYDVGFQRQCWQIQLLTDWCGDDAWVKRTSTQYRHFVLLSDVIRLGGSIVGKRRDEDGEYVVDVVTNAINQRAEDVMPGEAVIALSRRHETESPALRRARRGETLGK